jgi:putative ABC transport system permease protein
VRPRSRVSIFALIVEAARAVRRHALRSALTMLGVTIGIAAVVWVVALGRAGAERAEAELLALGDNLVWIEAGSRNVAGVRTGARGTTSLTLDDMEAIQRDVPAIKSASPNIDGSVLVVRGNRNWTTGYRGVYPEYLDIKKWTMAEGAPFDDADVTQARNVCIVGATLREQLFGSEPAVGRMVRIGSQPFEVLGVLDRKGQSGSGRDQDDTIMFPYTTAQQKIRGKGLTWLDDILCSARSPEDVDRAIAGVTAVLRERHHTMNDDDDFNIRRPEELLKAQLEASQTFALLLVSIASVALLVGGIGVMNVMLASVAERTREIGVRLTVGATPEAVQAQFLIEAVLLTVLGGALGVGVSVGGSSVLERALGWSVAIPIEALGLALGFSIAVGVVFGFYPAWRAARLNPIDALRSD